MNRHLRRVSATGSVAALLSCLFLATPLLAAPTDIVPRGDVAYDLLGSLASAGRIPGYSLSDFARGDRLYTRTEAARIVSRITPSKASSDPFAIAERTLQIEFAEELHGRAPDKFSLSPGVSAKSALLGGWFKVRALSDPTAGSGIGRFSASTPFGRDGYAVVSGGNWRDEWYDSSRFVGHARYDNIETAYARVDGRALDVTVGRLPLRWGPGYSSALLLNDDAPTRYQLQVQKSFLLPGTVGRHLGRVSFDEFAGEFYEQNDPSALPDAQGTQRYLVGRRFELQGGPWNFSLGEAMKSTRLPDPEWAAVLPLYLYQNDWTSSSHHRILGFLASSTEPDTYWKNYLADIDASYSLSRRSGASVYGGLLIDDLKAPKGFGVGNNTPQKLGEQLGVYVPHIGKRSKFGARLEYTSIDPGTYTNVSAPVAWTQNGVPLGDTTGPNAHVFFARVDARVSTRLQVSLDGTFRRDAGNLQPGQTAIHDNDFGLYASYSLRRDVFTGIRFGRQRDYSTGTDPTRFEANVAFGF